jgi:hypothetical protein
MSTHRPWHVGLIGTLSSRPRSNCSRCTSPWTLISSLTTCRALVDVGDAEDLAQQLAVALDVFDVLLGAHEAIAS